MAGVGLELTLAELPGWGASMAKAVLEGDFAPALRDCRIVLVAETRRCFDEARSPDGIPWAPLKNPSARRGGTSAKPLRDKGLLSGAATGGANSTTEIGRVSLTLSVKLAYAAAHQFGHTFSRSARSRNKPWVFRTGDGRVIFTRRIRAYKFEIPARPFLGFSPRAVETCGKILTEFAAKRWAGGS